MPDGMIGEETRIDAEVAVGDRLYTVRAAYDRASGGLGLSALDASGRDATAEYLYRSSHPGEQDAAEVFDGNAKIPCARLLEYISRERSPLDRSGARTDGLSIKSFCAYWHRFVKGFEPEIIRSGKPYELALAPSGVFFLRHTESGDPVTNLSESEQKLFGYLCFLWNAEFWRGYEEMRNLHGIRKPLLVLNFAECPDESIDMDALLQRTEALGRQVILIEAGNRES